VAGDIFSIDEPIKRLEFDVGKRPAPPEVIVKQPARWCRLNLIPIYYALTMILLAFTPGHEQLL
jgi:hypothetical protein